MTKKFGFLRFIAGFYKVMGIILLVLGVICAIGVLLNSIFGVTGLQNLGREFGMHDMFMYNGVLGRIFGALAILIGFGLSAICQFAISEAILVILAIEENTRATAGLLARQE
ncbi:MAG: hypothetical protein LLG42_09240 [Chloroflexi bacterium]|nr:hypothetical protein [Chloroflexota bacterium]